MNDRKGPRVLVDEALGKCRALVDEDSHSGFSIHALDSEELIKLAARRDADDAIRRWLKRKLRIYVESWITPALEEASQKLSKKIDPAERLVSAAYHAGMTPARIAKRLDMDESQAKNIGTVIQDAIKAGNSVEFLSEALRLR